MMTKEQFEAKSKADRKDQFSRFMDEPLTRAMISMIPPCEHIEALLQAAFNGGFSAGAVTTAISMISSVMQEPKR